MNCRSCNTNHSMVPSADGFGCICAISSISVGTSKCKPCNSTELISEDGTTCVPRRCQKSGGRVVCRKCPNDYIAVTQNFDGSPMKEVTCFKCARGYKVKDNKCVKCEACSCSKSEVVVSGACLPKTYVMERPKYNDNKLHPSSLLEIVKLEYLCNVKKSVAFGVERKQSGSLDVHISIETHYATKSPISQEITTSLVVKHEMLSAGVLWGLQVWGGVLCALLTLYAMVQWRGVVYRGGLQISLLPIISGCVADGLYFAALLSTLHALAAEAGALGITLPLSENEESTIKAITIAVLVLKIVKVAWMNWKQCQCDIFFIDWSEHNPPVSDSSKNNNTYDWRSVLLAREWMEMQTVRRVCPVATITLTLLILHILDGWQTYLPNSEGYTWVIGSLSWWSSYTFIFLINWLKDRFFTSPITRLAKVCSGVEMSLLVFQEEYYAHYVHGRSDEGGGSLKISGPLATCRLVCAPQVRIVYKKLANTQYGLGDNKSNRILLTRFLAAFFERALDGLNWVAIERTVLERLLDVELTNREGSNTSTLLYDIDSNVPSCFAVTWWGEEWTLATFDAMLFGCILIATGHVLMATVITLILWQIMKQIRQWFAHRNLRNKTDIEVV
ncbi:meckelin-like [Zerene cesonia]|uniref:meckelin-like n=1 Tax=Zerene cesonia TaxID=33412 RepID=UPI0018E4E5A6|nr:meckelin-like [Zerene cesonia]